MSRLKNAYAGCMECGGSVKMKSGGKWIQGAIKKPGSFTAQAKRAGMSVSAFRNKVLANKGDFSSTTVRRANLAKTLSKMRKGDDGMEVRDEVQINNPRSVQWETLPERMPSKPSSSPVTPSGLAKGGTEKVAAYQRMLKAKGFNIDVDGAWGPKTQRAYEQYMSSQAPKGTMGPNRSNLPSNNTYYKKVKEAPVSSRGDWYTPEQWDRATGRTADGLPSVSLPTSSGIKRRMLMGGSIPGVNGSVVGPAIPMSKTGQSFPRKNAGTSRLSKYKKK